MYRIHRVGDEVMVEEPRDKVDIDLIQTKRFYPHPLTAAHGALCCHTVGGQLAPYRRVPVCRR